MTAALDPFPWVHRINGERAQARGGVAMYDFAPGKQYEQDRAAYPDEISSNSRQNGEQS